MAVMHILDWYQPLLLKEQVIYHITEHKTEWASETKIFYSFVVYITTVCYCDAKL